MSFSLPFACRSERHTIRFGTFGSEDASEKVLMVMGYSMRGEAWRNQVPDVAKFGHVAIFDHAGLGQSGPISTTRLTMSILSDDALSVADALGWESFHLVGISMGGMIAQHLAISASDRLKSLTLIATHAGGPRRALPTLQGLKSFVQANASSDRINALAELLFPPEYLAENRAHAVDMLRQDFEGPPPTTTRIAQLHAVQSHRAASDLPRIRLPTMVVKPELDALIQPSNSDELARLIPGAMLVPFPHAGHGIVRQCPDELNATIIEHFSRNS